MLEDAAARRRDERVRTGVVGLDRVLFGGLLRGGVYILRGAPGAGKTTLAAQICFNHIGQGGRALFVTLLTESHARLIQQFRAFDFYSETAMARQFQMISAFTVLDAEHIGGVAKLLGHEVRRYEATILAVDGLGVMDDTPHAQRDVRLFLHELQSYAQASGCVCLLLTASARPTDSPEYAMADGVITLSASTVRMRTERSVQVQKMRGSDFFSGAHFYRITTGGIVVFPRIDGSDQPSEPTPLPDREAKHSTGIEGLDAMTGGLPVGSSTLIVGPAGAGKSTLGLQFLNAAQAHEPGLFFGFYERPEINLARAKRFGWDMEQRIARGWLEFLWEPPYGGLVDAICQKILDNVVRRGVRRLFIDGLGGFEQTAFAVERVGTELVALVNEARRYGVTSLFSLDLLGHETHDSHWDLSATIDNVILLRYAEIDSVLQRRISILKMRASDFDPVVRQFWIGTGGIRFEEPAVTGERPAPRAGAGTRGNGGPPG